MEDRRRKGIVGIMRWLAGCLVAFCLIGTVSAEGLRDVPGQRYEKNLLETIKQIQGLDHQQALEGTRSLLEQYPHSRIGQMLYADLLLAKAGPLVRIGSGLKADQAVNDFKHEIRQRLHHEQGDAHRNMFPGNIVFLAENQPYAILVDLAGSRAYVYRNQEGTPILETDYFITIGLNGAGKQEEGDQKTPIGVYHVTRYIDDDELPDLYGRGAFPINYPNVWDLRKNRTGSGIWIHGTPSYTYNRPPWASDGCIVVSNPDFIHIGQYIKPQLHTPVVIADRVEWLSQEQWLSQRQQWLKTISAWINDWQSLQHDRYRRHYSVAEFSAYGRDFEKWDGHKRWVNRNKTYVNVEYNNLSVFNYPGEENLVLVQFYQNYASSNFSLKSPKELYWRLENQQWQIVYEGARTFPEPDTEVAEN